MYTLTMMQAGGYDGVVIIALILAVAVWFLTIGGHEFYRGQDVSGHYKAFYVGLFIIVVVSVILCAMISNIKVENKPIKATYVSHATVPNSNLFRITFKLENGSLVQAEPHPIVYSPNETVTLYWNKK